MSKEIDDLVKKGIIQGLGFYILLAVIYVMKFPKWIAYLLLGLGILYLLYMLFVIWFIDKALESLSKDSSVKLKVPKKIYGVVLFMIVLNSGLIYVFSKRGDSSDKSSKSSSKKSK